MPTKTSKKTLNAKQKRMFFVGAILLSSLFAIISIFTTFRENLVFFYSPKELQELQNQGKLSKMLAAKTKIRVGGMVLEGSLQKIDNLTTEFFITDYQKTLKIHYLGILPDLFREGQGVVANGFLKGTVNENSKTPTSKIKMDKEVNSFAEDEEYSDEELNLVFESKELLVKHDEKYMPPEVARAIGNKKKR